MQLRLTDDSIPSHARLLRRLQIPVIVLLVIAVPVVYAPQKESLVDAQSDVSGTETIPVSTEDNPVTEILESPETNTITDNGADGTASEVTTTGLLENQNALPYENTDVSNSQPTTDIGSSTYEADSHATDLNESPLADEELSSSESTGISEQILDQIEQVPAPVKEKIAMVGNLKTSLIHKTWEGTKRATEWLKQAKPKVETQTMLVIRNSKTNRGSVAFLVDKEVKSLAPGEECKIEGDSTHTIRFHRGGEFGQAAIELQTGEFEFQVTDRGWDLVEPTDE